MKRVLITGANSYIGISLKNYLMKWPNEFVIDIMDVVNDSWKSKSFSNFDVIFHVAGIVHKKERHDMEQLYYRVNCDLAVSIAEKAKHEGVKQFIFMSSKGVYSPNTPLITRTTEPHPTKLYGMSKYRAEQLLSRLSSSTFIVSILRPPTVYGKGCAGNYPKLSKLARVSPVFPFVRSQRSMIYIDNLCEFIRLVIDNNWDGLLFPQNNEYVCTTELVGQIADYHKKRIHMSRLLGILMPLFMFINSAVRTMFSDSVYDKSLSEYDHYDYCKVNFRESIILSETD